MLATLFVSAPAFAQTSPTAPAGNAHPEAKSVSDMTGVNPFGEFVEATMTGRAKREFADKLDLSPLRDLAVFHDGRLKILDTLARETIKDVAGRKDFVDWISSGESSGGDSNSKPAAALKKVKYDPLFTFLDLMIDPLFYGDKALVHVEYLPLREELLKTAYTDKDEYTWWLKLGRVKPELIMQHGAELMRQHQFDDGFRGGLMHVSSAMNRYGKSWQNLLMVAPPASDQKWQNLAFVLDGSKGPALRDAVNDLASGWRAGDAAKVNAASKVLAAELPKVNPETYPTTRREVERLYNAVNPFEWGYWMYCLSLISLLLAFGTGRKWLVGVGITTLFAAIGLHVFGFASRCYIAERLAIQNQFESMTGLSLGATLVGTVVMLA
ncbi:MAG: hypothetical protein H7210_06565, partial [Pyrinomonadaceae bacterium]|nr:hypothetical protein [Phycisphaerales bacterium]